MGWNRERHAGIDSEEGGSTSGSFEFEPSFRSAASLLKYTGLPVAMGTSSRLKEGRTMDSRASPHCTHGAQPQEMLSNGTGGLPPSYKAPERRGSEASLNSNVDACRICHCEAEPGAPLISPCVCSGSLKFVHQACLQQWIKSADTKSCELCKYDFEMTTRIKPFRKWQKLQMSTVERRKIMCSVTFHLIAITCVIWSLYVLIDRTTEEIKQGVLEWPFWTKLIVVAIGFTGGLVFMYVQCKMYVHLCRRWRAYNRVIYIQNCPKLGGNKQPFAGSPRHGHGDGDGDKLSDSSNNSMQETELV